MTDLAPFGEVLDSLREIPLRDEPDEIPHYEPDAIPTTFGEMRDAFMGLIWQQRGSLKGTALVQALTALSRLAELDHDQPDETTRDVDVLDLIQTEGVLPDRKKDLLTAERTRTLERLARIDTELEGL